jgi:peptidoglycan/xylan/chitin deacetylase (PgdA/CDA1 family)
MKRWWMILALGGSVLLSCNLTSPAPAAPVPTATATPTLSLPSATATVTQTFTPSPVPTATWARFGPGVITVPIILYHHVGYHSGGDRFYVSPERFEQEMKYLHDQGYTSISVETLVTAITQGAELPPHPVIITFDDGNLDTYVEAYPITEKYGLTGVIYIVGSYIGADGYMSRDQIQEMAASGWEVGSHTMTHADLTLLDPDGLRYEVLKSREYLEKILGVPVTSIAYPFGNSTIAINDLAYAAGYIAGMSLGSSSSYGSANLYVLQRLDVKGEYELTEFKLLLPVWTE